MIPDRSHPAERAARAFSYGAYYSRRNCEVIVEFNCVTGKRSRGTMIRASLLLGRTCTREVIEPRRWLGPRINGTAICGRRYAEMELIEPFIMHDKSYKFTRDYAQMTIRISSTFRSIQSHPRMSAAIYRAPRSAPFT